MTGADNGNVLSYESPGPRKLRHSVFGVLALVWPALLVLYCGDAFGRAGAFLVPAAPALTLAAVVEALICRRRLALPLCAFIVSSAISAGILYGPMSD
jgi:hypothetical protein